MKQTHTSINHNLTKSCAHAFQFDNWDIQAIVGWDNKVVSESIFVIQCIKLSNIYKYRK